MGHPENRGTTSAPSEAGALKEVKVLYSQLQPEGKVIRTHIGYGEGSLKPLVAELNALIAKYKPEPNVLQNNP